MRFSELPDEIRVKLSEKGSREFWKRIDEFGGVSSFADAFDHSRSKMYNWRSKDCFLPVEVVRKVMGNEASEEVVAYKGQGRSNAVENPVFPLPVSDELLTRIYCSVTVNSQGVPVYQTGDRGLVERFTDLLGLYGDTPYRFYSRSSVYEVRYPGYLQKLFEQMVYEESFTALVDEEGSVGSGFVEAGGERRSIEEFGGEIYSRDKALRLALERGNDEKVRRLMVKEAEKVEKTFRN